MFLLFIFQVVFYSSYCLDIYVCSENYIKVRDAAISLFNQGKAMEEIQPIPFIKNFLLRYVDEAALQRRQSQAAEDDNPPSPTMVGGMYILIFNQFIDHCFQVNDCSSKILLIKGGTQSCDRQTYVLTKIMNRDNKNWAHF